MKPDKQEVGTEPQAARRVIPGSSVVLTTASALIAGFVFTVGCAVFSLERAAGRTERELMTAVLWIVVPLVIAALCLWGAAARYRAANRSSR